MDDLTPHEAMRRGFAWIPVIALAGIGFIFLIMFWAHLWIWAGNSVAIQAAKSQASVGAVQASASNSIYQDNPGTTGNTSK